MKENQSPFLLLLSWAAASPRPQITLNFLGSGSFKLCHKVWVWPFETLIITKVARAANGPCDRRRWRDRNEILSRLHISPTLLLAVRSTWKRRCVDVLYYVRSLVDDLFDTTKKHLTETFSQFILLLHVYSIVIIWDFRAKQLIQSALRRK